jgi:phage-related protein
MIVTTRFASLQAAGHPPHTVGRPSAGWALYSRNAILVEAVGSVLAKAVEWIASARADLKRFPAEVQDAFGYALYQVQLGETPPNAKPLRGPLRDVVEIAEQGSGGTYRLVYTVKIGDVVYVLHAFQKKSRRGIATPKAELDLIAQRLRKARADHEDQAHR